jgi:hypothetical protein
VSPDPERAGGLDDRHRVVVGAVVNVEELHGGGDPHPQHLGKVKARADADRMPVQTGRRGMHKLAHPAAEGQVITESADERLKGVTVAVDAPRQYGDVPPVLTGQPIRSCADGDRPSRGEGPGGAGREDLVIVDEDLGVGDPLAVDEREGSRDEPSAHVELPSRASTAA